MPDETRTVVTFKSDAFNTSEPRPHFINPCCFGDDLAGWILVALRERGVTTLEGPDQEDFGWYLNFTEDGVEHTLVLGYRAGDGEAPGDWVGWLERNCGFVASILGGRKRGVLAAAATAVNGVLGDPRFRDVKWHYRADFDAGSEERGSPFP